MRWFTFSLCCVLAGCAEELPSTPVDFAPADEAAFEDAPEMKTSKASNPTDVAPEDVVYFFDSVNIQDGVLDIDEDAKDREFQTTDSGLKYRILRNSDGSKPTADNKVKVYYRGWFDNGEVFDGNFGSDPIEFGLRGVVAGWTEGIPLVGKGGVIELVIPYQLGYGEGGRPPVIPPKATLHFVVELLDIM